MELEVAAEVVGSGPVLGQGQESVVAGHQHPGYAPTQDPLTGRAHGRQQLLWGLCLG